MSGQIIASGLLVELSTEEQQLLSGGQYGGYEDKDKDKDRDRDRDRYKCRYCYDCYRYRD